MYITPDHVVGKVWLHHQELGIDLKLRQKLHKDSYPLNGPQNVLETTQTMNKFHENKNKQLLNNCMTYNNRTL